MGLLKLNIANQPINFIGLLGSASNCFGSFAAVHVDWQPVHVHWNRLSSETGVCLWSVNAVI